MANDYGFLGFTYSSCGDANTAKRDLAKMKSLGARHVRMYGWCNDQWLGYVLEAAGQTGLGVIPIVWFGYSQQEYNDAKRKETLLVNTIKSHRYGNHVVAVSVGNELLFDGALSEDQLIATVKRVRASLSSMRIPVGTSEMPYKMTSHVASNEDLRMANILPYFANDATDGGSAWKDMIGDIDKSRNLAGNKKFVLIETYWAWKLNEWKPHSGRAVTSLQSMQNFWNMLSNHCPDWKNWNAGYFAYCFNDDCMDGLGITDGNKPRIQWAPKTSC